MLHLQAQEWRCDRHSAARLCHAWPPRLLVKRGGALSPRPMETYDTVQQMARECYSRLLAVVVARTWDLALAEDALSEAFQAALCHWPKEGVPRSPEAWLVAVAKRRLVDEHRHRATIEAADPDLRRAAELTALTDVYELASQGAVPDERLKLLFICAHPAIDAAARTPLMLQTVLGLDAARIASAFLVAPRAMSQRLVRAKTKIHAARIPFCVPENPELTGRLESVLEAIYAAYGTGWDDASGINGPECGLTGEAIWLARVLVRLMPGEPEVAGLLALFLHCEARRPARRDADGNYIPLSAQNSALWIRPLMSEAEMLLRSAASDGRPGRFQLEAAIQSAHASRAFTGQTPWPGILELYDKLLRVAGTIGSHVAYAAALLQSGDSVAALNQLAGLCPESVAAYQPYWAVKAHALLGTESSDECRAAFQRAAGLTQDAAVRRHLLRLCPPD